MNKQELWDAFLAQHPQFKDEESIVKLKSRGLKRLTDQSWDEGFERGKAVSKALYDLTKLGNKKPSSPFDGLFGEL